jgi:hypothetical protein
MLPQKRQASLHDAQDGAAQRQSGRLHVHLGKVSFFARMCLRGSFFNLQT